MPFAPTLTAPLAQVWPAPHVCVGAGSAASVIVPITPKFCPTRPPAAAFWQELVAPQSALFCGTLALAVTFPVA